ncbi:MAG: hypothetical protein KBF98_08715 [Rhodoferax sp.]|jgi:hypothetical protein|nr:hypothetical protein [Rhodoferax sp.]MBP9060384.1 hypothetical protein [Rhodoferax sp.]MBP9684693.1 hypothetical protein [Rhodoferax sp.]
MSHHQTNEIEAPTVVDVEASGFGRASYPIEVGFVLPNGHSFCSLIYPEPEWTHWDPQAETIHHISRELLLKKGHPACEVAHLLNSQLRGQTVYTDGWANDYSWLGRLFDVADLSPAFKLENLRVLLKEDEAERWHAVKSEVAHERGPQRHRASADARLLQLTLLRIWERPNAQ